MSQTAAARSTTARTPEQTGRFLTIALFTIYAAVLVGVVLFKFPFPYQLAGSGRALNLVPFAGSITSGGAFRLGEIGDNVLIFVPLGVYICALTGDWSFTKKIFPIIGTTVAFETIQYIFAIGRADITDVLTNTLGGLIGIAIYATTEDPWSDHHRRTDTDDRRAADPDRSVHQKHVRVRAVSQPVEAREVVQVAAYRRHIEN